MSLREEVDKEEVLSAQEMEQLKERKEQTHAELDTRRERVTSGQGSDCPNLTESRPLVGVGPVAVYVSPFFLRGTGAVTVKHEKHNLKSTTERFANKNVKTIRYCI